MLCHCCHKNNVDQLTVLYSSCEYVYQTAGDRLATNNINKQLCHYNYILAVIRLLCNLDGIDFGTSLSGLSWKWPFNECRVMLCYMATKYHRRTAQNIPTTAPCHCHVSNKSHAYKQATIFTATSQVQLHQNSLRELWIFLEPLFFT